MDHTDSKNTGRLPVRSEIKEEYKWNLHDIYKTEDAWESDFKWVEQSLSRYNEYKGNLGKSAEFLLQFFKMDEEIRIKFGRLIRYSILAKDLDLTDVKYQGLNERANSLDAKLELECSFIEPELLSIPEEQLRSYLQENTKLKIYVHRFDDLFRMKPHILPREIEEVMALSGPLQKIPYDVYSLYSDADIKFPNVVNERGSEVEISHGRFYAALESPDREYRQRVYKNFHLPFKEHKNSLCALFLGNIKANFFEAKARKFSSNRKAALVPNNIPESVYENLVSNVNANLQPLHRWSAMKKKILGVEELHPYDTYVTLFPSVSKDYSYEEGKKLLQQSLKPLGEDYLQNLKFAFENRWIDVYENKGKRSGAYSSGVTYGFHPFVLMNWTDKLSDVFTFAHEMGHNMHSFYTERAQPFVYANYSIFIAEVASTLNEALLLDYLLSNATGKEEKLSLIERHLNNITTTFYRQTRFAEFEQIVHELHENGEPLTPDKLCKIFSDLYQKYWGQEMTVDEEETYTWARIPHFYYNFYVYQYATSFAASELLAEKLIVEGQPAVDKYLEFLKSGNSIYPIDLLKKTGVDLISPEPILTATRKMESLLDQMENLLAEN